MRSRERQRARVMASVVALSPAWVPSLFELTDEGRAYVERARRGQVTQEAA